MKRSLCSALAAGLLVSACSGTSAPRAVAPSPTASPTPSPTPSATPTPTPSPTASPTPNRTASPRPRRSASPTPSPAALPRISGQPLAGRTIVLDPGHNGLNSRYPERANAQVPAGGFTKPCNTTGTETNDGYTEHAYAFDVARRTAALLRSQGAKVVLTRPNDSGFGPCVNERAAIANRAQAAATVSIHADGADAGAYGFHVIEPGEAPDHGNRAILAASARLALALRAGYRSATGEAYSTYLGHDGIDRRSDLAGLNLARVPAVFIECGNMRNASDSGRMKSAAFRQRAAAGIDQALVAYLS